MQKYDVINNTFRRALKLSPNEYMVALYVKSVQEKDKSFGVDEASQELFITQKQVVRALDKLLDLRLITCYGSRLAVSAKFYYWNGAN